MRPSSERLERVVSNAISRPARASSSSRCSVTRPAAISDSPSSLAITSALTNSSTRRTPLSSSGAEVDFPAPFGPAMMKSFGISRDSLKSHEGFKAKLKFPFELLSGPDEALCSAFGVMKDKNMYGRKVRGIERSTFVIDEKGRLAREWRGVKVPGHVEEVLNFVKAL